MSLFSGRTGPPHNAFTAGDVWESTFQRERFDGTAWQPVAYLGQAATGLAASGGASIDWTQGRLFTLTPTQSQNVSAASVPPAGYQCTLAVLTAGTSSFTQTFTTNIKSTGTLATGTADAKYFAVRFESDGNFLLEVSRTAAM